MSLVGNFFDQVFTGGRNRDAINTITSTAAGWAAGGPLGGYVGYNIGQAGPNQKRADQQFEETMRIQQENMQKQIDLQKEFAKNGLSWKIDDAKSRGISPLAALGAQGASFQPMSIDTPQRGESEWSKAGQNIMDAVFKNHMLRQQLMGSDLDNKMKEAQIGLINAQTSQLANPTNMDRDQNYSEKNQAPMNQWTWLPQKDGKYRIQSQMTVDGASRLQDDFLGKLRYQVDRAFGLYKPPQKLLPPGFSRWEKTGIEGVWEATDYDQNYLLPQGPVRVPKKK